MISDLGNRRDVFIRRQTWNEVIELKDEPDMLPAVEGQATVIELGEVEILEEDRAAGSGVEPPMMFKSVDLPLPEGPNRTTTSPDCTSRSTPRKA